MYFLAAIRSDPAPAAATPFPAGATPPPLRAIAPPVEIFPFTLLQMAVAGAVLLLVVGLLVWWLARRPPRRPAAPPPTPRQVALAALARLREQVRTLEAYAFSIQVSEVLRTFVEGQYGLRALARTSPEFLAELAHAREFTSEDRQLLAAFLERSDLIKFARVEAGAEASEELLTSASTFVQGGRA